jgi:hypothetical protein
MTTSSGRAYQVAQRAASSFWADGSLLHFAFVPKLGQPGRQYLGKGMMTSATTIDNVHDASRCRTGGVPPLWDADLLGAQLCATLKCLAGRIEIARSIGRGHRGALAIEVNPDWKVIGTSRVGGVGEVGIPFARMQTENANIFEVFCTGGSPPRAYDADVR